MNPDAKRSNKRAAAAGASLLILLLTSPLALAGGATSMSGELNLIGGYSGTNDWIGAVPGAPRNSVGFEYFRRLSGERGDFLTIDVQARLSFEPESRTDNDWGVELHNAWVEHKLGLGKNIVVGHFSPAHGLEPVTDTHGTVLQTLAMWDVGFKKDWGAGYRGILGPFDLSVAGQLGSGMGIRTDDGSYLLTAQIWEPPGDGFRYGLSLLAGRVLPSRGGWTLPSPDFAPGTVAKTRVSAAATVSRGSFDYAGELSAGWNEDDAVAGALLQVGYVLPSLQQLTLEAQGRLWADDLSGDDRRMTSVTAGGSYELTRGWTIRAYLSHDLEMPGDTGDTRAVLQAYYFGG